MRGALVHVSVDEDAAVGGSREDPGLRYLAVSSMSWLPAALWWNVSSVVLENVATRWSARRVAGRGTCAGWNAQSTTLAPAPAPGWCSTLTCASPHELRGDDGRIKEVAAADRDDERVLQEVVVDHRVVDMALPVV